MNVVLRFSIGTLMAFLLPACSPTPLETTLPQTMRVASLPTLKSNPPKTLSSNILAAIALERVTGQRVAVMNDADPISNHDRRQN